MEDVGYLKVKIEELLKERNISKNKICFDLRIQRTQLNRYCKGDVQRLDVNLYAESVIIRIVGFRM